MAALSTRDKAHVRIAFLQNAQHRVVAGQSRHGRVNNRAALVEHEIQFYALLL